MVIAKWNQIRLNDKVIVFQFYDDNGNEIGSRGISVSDEDMKLLNSLSFGDMVKYKTDGVQIPDKLSGDEGIMEKLAYNGYNEYLSAKKLDEAQKSQIIEM